MYKQRRSQYKYQQTIINYSMLILMMLGIIGCTDDGGVQNPPPPPDYDWSTYAEPPWAAPGDEITLFIEWEKQEDEGEGNVIKMYLRHPFTLPYDPIPPEDGGPMAEGTVDFSENGIYSLSYTIPEDVGYGGYYVEADVRDCFIDPPLNDSPNNYRRESQMAIFVVTQDLYPVSSEPRVEVWPNMVTSSINGISTYKTGVMVFADDQNEVWGGWEDHRFFVFLKNSFNDVISRSNMVFLNNTENRLGGSIFFVDLTPSMVGDNDATIGAAYFDDYYEEEGEVWEVPAGTHTIEITPPPNALNCFDVDVFYPYNDNIDYFCQFYENNEELRNEFDECFAQIRKEFSFIRQNSLPRNCEDYISVDLLTVERREIYQSFMNAFYENWVEYYHSRITLAMTDGMHVQLVNKDGDVIRVEHWGFSGHFTYLFDSCDVSHNMMTHHYESIIVMEARNIQTKFDHDDLPMYTNDIPYLQNRHDLNNQYGTLFIGSLAHEMGHTMSFFDSLDYDIAYDDHNIHTEGDEECVMRSGALFCPEEETDGYNQWYRRCTGNPHFCERHKQRYRRAR